MMIKGVEVIDHTQECIDAKNIAVERALEAIGLQAESYAKKNLTASGHIDTGLLRNSIAHAVSGNVPTTRGQTTYKADRAKSKYTGYKNAERNEKGHIVKKSGEYSSPVPDDAENQKAVYVGSNVHYAPYIEYGSDRLAPTHFVKNALADNTSVYAKIAENCLKNV